MSTARAAIKRVRQVLEEGLPAVTARAVLFHALSQWGPQVPEDRAELVRFVRGSLKKVLEAHLPADRWVPLVVAIENSLAVVDVEDDEAPSPHPSNRPPPMGGDALETRELRTVSAPARVLVVAAGAHFANTLQLTLGPDEVSAARAHGLDEVREGMVQELEILVVDGSDPPSVEPTRLAAALGQLPPDAVVAVWASEEGFGRDIAAALDACGLACAPFVREEGIAPFLDLVRSRRAQ